MAREAGAKKVYMASAAPAVRYPNVYGIDMPSAQELIAHNRTDQEVAKIIGADWLVYQDIDDLVESAREGNPSIKKFDCAVFDADYITGDVDQHYLDLLESKRNDSAKMKNSSASGDRSVDVLGLHNSDAERA